MITFTLKTQHELKLDLVRCRLQVEVDSYLLSDYKIKAWVIYYEIQHCLPIDIGYG